MRHWAGDSQRVFVAFTLQGTLGSSTIQLPIIDDIRLIDGLIRERAAYFDPWPMLRALLLQPWLWWRLLRNPNA